MRREDYLARGRRTRFGVAERAHLPGAQEPLSRRIASLIVTTLVLLATVIAGLALVPAAAAAQTPGPEVPDQGCSATTLPANDDGSTGSITLPFVADFFGTNYSALYVNNNGNVTFQGPLGTFTPFTINANTPPIIAPFFADVDTRGAGSSPVTYGTTTFGSRQAFCVNWNDVGYYASHTDKLNSFQLLLVDRSDAGAGDFDVIMNYGAITWETGDASGGSNGFGGTAAGAGFSAGDGNPDHFFEFPGSLTPGGLLDTNPTTGLVNNSRGTLEPGRYVFPVRNGAPPGSGTFTGTVRDTAGGAQSTAPVQACPADGGSCVIGFSNTDGRYSIVGVTPGSWNLTANPPAGSNLLPDRAGPLTVATGETITQDFILEGPTGPPAGTTITSRGSSGAIPVIYWNDPLTLDTTGCANGTASYTLTLNDGRTVRSGPLTETPAGSGHYQAQIAPLFPEHGDATVRITFTCPDGSHPDISFSIYIDPSGTIVDPTGAPISGATVTLLRSDASTGPFEAVPDGSAVMSPSNRTNPFVTGPDGIFHWDVIAGFYQVKASKQGCLGDDGSDTTTTVVYEIPPPVTDLRLVLDCGQAAVQTQTQLSVSPASPTAANTVQTLTASVTPATAAGSVQFRDGANPLGNPVTVTNGTASTTTTLPPGNHSLTAEFIPTNAAAFTGSTSAAVPYLVNAAVTATTLSVTPASPAVKNTVQTLTATVTPAAAGSVQFKDGANPLGNPVTVTNGTATATTTLPVGTHSLTAVFTPTDPVAFTPSASAAVPYVVYNTATSTTLTVAPNPSIQGSPVALIAKVTPFTAAGTVQFKDGATALGAPVPVTGGFAFLNISTLARGTHTLTAVFTPTNPVASGPSTSPPVTLTVRPLF
ncbi:MAG: Ig-like domain repeat protein [Pseudonocardiaceae bacterium]